jgi:hypothetical protein
LPGEDINDVGLSGDLLQVRYRGRGVGGGVQEDQRDVVGGDPLRGDTGIVHDYGGVDLRVELGINRRLSMFCCDDDERLIVDALCLKFADYRADGGVDAVDGLEEERREREACSVEVPADFLPNVHGLEVACEEGGDGCETPFGVGGDFPIQPGEPRVDVEEVVGDSRGDVAPGNSLDLGEVPCRQTSPARPTHDIIGGVLVRVGGLEAVGDEDFKGGVDAEAGVWVLGDAGAVFEPEGEVGRVDAAGEEEGLIVVEVFG